MWFSTINFYHLIYHSSLPETPKWSFGVTCWEIYSGGKLPYAGMSPMDLPRKLELGYRMDIPVNAACSGEM